MPTRRALLQSVAAAALASPLFGQERALDPKLTLHVPLTHSDWMLHPNVPGGEAGVRHMLDACKACGWFNVHWRVFDAGQATYRSQLMRPGMRSEAHTIHNPSAEDLPAVRKLLPNFNPQQSAGYLKKYEQIDYAAFDSLAAACEHGHRIGLKIHAWATINEDDHGWGWQSEFSKAHPEFRWVRRDGTPYRSQLSFAFDEVRRYKLGLIRELLAYPIDGLMLDWIRTGDIRDNPQTDGDGVANSGYESPNVETYRKVHGRDPHEVANGDEAWVGVRAQPQTLFMRDVRQLARQHKPSLPIAVLVGHRWHYRGAGDKIGGNLRGLLLDVEAWAKEGLIDAAIPAGYYRDGGTPARAYQALRRETEGKVDVWPYAWVPNAPADFERDAALTRELGATSMLLWEADYIEVRPNAAELKAAMSRLSRS